MGTLMLESVEADSLNLHVIENFVSSSKNYSHLLQPKNTIPRPFAQGDMYKNE